MQLNGLISWIIEAERMDNDYQYMAEEDRLILFNHFKGPRVISWRVSKSYEFLFLRTSRYKVCGQGEDIPRIWNCIKGKEKQVENKSVTAHFTVLLIVDINYT